MLRRLLALVPALVLVACSGGTAASPSAAPTLALQTAVPSVAATVAPTASPTPTPSPSPTASPTPSPTASPTPTPSPTPSPTPTRAPTPPPTATPEPSESEDPESPTSRALLVDTLLDARDVPDDLEPGELESSEQVADDAFAANNGLRVIRIVWQGSGDGPITTIYDYRYQFPNEDDAATFLDEARDFLAETSEGMELTTEFDVDELGELGFLYTGEVEGLEGFQYNYLLRVGNIVAKVWVTVPSTQDPDVPLGVAQSAAETLRAVLQIEAPTADFPNANEARILEFVPEPIRDSCHAAEEIYRDEIDTVRCDGSTEHPPIDYSLFRTRSAMNGAFDRDLAREETEPTDEGSCAEGNYLAEYTIEGEPGGRILCTIYTDTDDREYKVIEWTNENINILTYMSSATRDWDNLIEFWTDEAGPINP